MPIGIYNIIIMPNQNLSKKDIQQQTEQLKRNMAELNSTLIQLAKNQEGLGEQLQESSEGFKAMATNAKDTVKELQSLTSQINNNSKAIDDSKKNRCSKIR
jgi:septal ring factor EnvC (AmiA/AmiB activator)